MFDILPFIIIVILSFVTVTVLFLYIRQNSDIKKLKNSINEYLNSGENIPFSLSDSRVLSLQNDISDIQSLVSKQKTECDNQIRKNTEFVQDISHQLKTPLAALRLYTEMDKSACPTPHTDKLLQIIEKTENLVLNILKLEKFTSDTYLLDFADCEIERLVEEIVNPFKLMFPNKTFNIDGKAVLHCDSFWIREAFANIIKNSAEHTDKKGIVNIKITDSHSSVTVEIADNGQGVHTEELSKIFTRFYKTKNSLPQSAGLGLAITKSIVEKHHGIITAENKNGSLVIMMCFPKIDGVKAI